MVKQYTAKEVYDLKLLPLKPRTLMEYARVGKIDSAKQGRVVVFTDEDIAKFIKSSRRTRDAKPSRSPKYASATK